MVRNLSSRVDQYFIDNFIADSKWDITNARGFDPTQTDPSADDFCPAAYSLDNIGAHYPSIVIQRSTEVVAGETGYTYLSSGNPAQERDGTLIATIRAQDKPTGGYTGDSGTYSATDAETIVEEIADEIENVCLRNPNGASTDFHNLGSFPGPEAPDDDTETPTVRIASRSIVYQWLRD